MTSWLIYGQENVIHPSLVPCWRWHEQGPNPNRKSDHFCLQNLIFSKKWIIFRGVDNKIKTLDIIISYLFHFVYNIVDFACLFFCCCWGVFCFCFFLQPKVKKIKRVRTRVVGIVVVVKELLFLVTSVICVRIRSRGSEVTTTP